MADTVKVTLPTGAVIHTTPENAARLAANGGTVDAPKPAKEPASKTGKARSAKE